MNQLRKQFRFVRWPRNYAWTGLWTLCLATFAGNAMIAGGHVLLILAVIAQLSLLLARGSGRYLMDPSKIRPSSWLLLAFITVSALSIFLHWSDYAAPLDTLKKLRYELIILALLLVRGCPEYLQSRVSLTFALVFLALSALVVCPAGVISYFTGFNPITGDPLKHGRAGGVSGTVMSFAYSLQFFVLPLTALLFCRRSEREWFTALFPARFGIAVAGLVFLVVLTAFYYAESRGAFAGAAVGGLVLLCFLKNGKLWFAAITLGALILVVALLSDSRLLSVSDPIRLRVWETAIRCAADHPVSGIGYRQLEVRSDVLAEKYGIEPIDDPSVPFRYFKGHAHNNYLEAFAGSGVPGGLLFCGFCLAWLREGFGSRRCRLFLVPSIVAFCVSGMFESTFIDSETVNIILLLYLATQLVLRTESHGKSDPEPSGES